MSYSALARKWRPKTFAALKGQDHVTKALINALTRQQLHHAYLFTGTRGVGKTTVARIFAKCLNCEQGILAEPCGVCDTCQSIDSGRYIDLIEVDAASKTKVEDTRELLDNVQYAPAAGRFKVYLIDEVHMLSGHSFNALLKTLEEPPAHVKFILATTDPEKIPATILSRCLNFHLRAMHENEISAQLAYILQQENISYEEPALTLLAVFAKGSMRDGLSLLEQAVSICKDVVNLHDVEFMLGMQYRQHITPLLDAIYRQALSEANTWAQKILDLGAKIEDVLSALLEQIYRQALQAALSASQNRNIEPTPETLQVLYQIGLNGQRDLPYAPNPRIGFEMTLLRMIAFLPAQTDAVAVVPGIALQSTPSIPTPPINKAAARPSTHLRSERTENATQSSTQNSAKSLDQGSDQSSAQSASWHEIVEVLPLAGLTRILLKHCSLASWEGNHIQLILDSSQEACLNQNRQMQIQQALTDYLKKPISLKITCAQQTAITPIEQDQKTHQQAEHAARARLLKDEKVQTILKTFDATLEDISYEKK